MQLQYLSVLCGMVGSMDTIAPDESSKDRSNTVAEHDKRLVARRGDGGEMTHIDNRGVCMRWHRGPAVSGEAVEREAGFNECCQGADEDVTVEEEEGGQRALQQSGSGSLSQVEQTGPDGAEPEAHSTPRAGPNLAALQTQDITNTS
ncbi:hypothetical protein D9C73_001896 [Collichthys lucidus]|uniref:Uncharacterized protein n=1 Tax=Collichthys lucidus TaxID=240159 RepID=A0A4U5U0G7_COLLU|nr:hypothetical protein D9C73_001896 [Collichthys lucidus]